MAEENNEQPLQPLEELLAKPTEPDWEKIARETAELNQKLKLELEKRTAKDEAEQKEQEFVKKLEEAKGGNHFRITPEVEKLAEEQGLWKSPAKSKSRTDPRWYPQPTEKQLEIIREKQKEQRYQM